MPLRNKLYIAKKTETSENEPKTEEMGINKKMEETKC